MKYDRDGRNLLGPERRRSEAERLFFRALAEGKKSALAIVKKNFEDAVDKEKQLPFHNTLHTLSVMRRTRAILEAIRRVAPELVNEREVELGEFAAAHHDTVQDYEAVSENGKVMRKRFWGQNETASAEGAVEFMKEANQKNGQAIFSEEDMRIVYEAIIVTIPDYDQKIETIIQPRLKDARTLIARAVALSDLGSAGLEGAGAYTKEGDALFREENLDILRLLKKDVALSEVQKEYFKTRLLAWAKSQVLFAEKRRAMFNDELSGFPEVAREAIRRLFNKFDDSIEASKRKVEAREKMSFEDIAKDMGYQ